MLLNASVHQKIESEIGPDPTFTVDRDITGIIRTPNRCFMRMYLRRLHNVYARVSFPLQSTNGVLIRCPEMYMVVDARAHALMVDA